MTRMDLCCTLCDEPLIIKEEHIQCPSQSHHAFCFRCTTIFIWKHATDKEIYCPSGEKCVLDNKPWEFWDTTIEEVLGEEFEEFIEVRSAVLEKEREEVSDESQSFVNPFECPTNGEMDELRERVRILEEKEKKRDEREDRLIKILERMEKQLREFSISKENRDLTY